MEGQRKFKIYAREPHEHHFFTSFLDFPKYFYVFQRWLKGHTTLVGGLDLALGLPTENPCSLSENQGCIFFFMGCKPNFPHVFYEQRADFHSIFKKKTKKPKKQKQKNPSLQIQNFSRNELQNSCFFFYHDENPTWANMMLLWCNSILICCLFDTGRSKYIGFQCLTVIKHLLYTVFFHHNLTINQLIIFSTPPNNLVFETLSKYHIVNELFQNWDIMHGG